MKAKAAMGLFTPDLYRSFFLGFGITCPRAGCTYRSATGIRAACASKPCLLRIALTASACSPAIAGRKRRQGACRCPRCARKRRPEDRDLFGRLLLGCRGGVQPHQGREQRGFGLRRRDQGHGRLRICVLGQHRPRRIGQGYSTIPSVVRYDQLLQVFFSVVADPTLNNRRVPTTARSTTPRWSR